MDDIQKPSYDFTFLDVPLFKYTTWDTNGYADPDGQTHTVYIDPVWYFSHLIQYNHVSTIMFPSGYVKILQKNKKPFPLYDFNDIRLNLIELYQLPITKRK